MKKRWSQTKNKGAVELEPTHFYHSCGAPVSGDLEHFKGLAAGLPGDRTSAVAVFVC